MRVLLPALVPSRQATGVGIYVRELVRAWQDLGGPELLVAAPEAVGFDFVREGGPVRLLRVGGGRIPRRVLSLHLQIPRLARERRADVILSPNFLAPVRTAPCRSAVVVQDLAFVHHGSTIPLARRMYYLALARWSIRRAAAVLVSTRTVAEEVAAFESSIASRIRIAPLGAPSTHLATDPDPEDRRSGALLSVGTLEPRKNLARVLLAHGRLCRRFPDFPALRLVGGAGWGQRQVADALAGHPAPRKVVRLGYLQEEELIAEYRKARGLVFCSTYEGFGLPVVEAMRWGCPVLCSSGTALAEVADAAALLADPADVGELERAMLRLATDAPLRRRLAEAGLERARQFSWERCARRTIDALEELAAPCATRGQ